VRQPLPVGREIPIEVEVKPHYRLAEVPQSNYGSQRGIFGDARIGKYDVEPPFLALDLGEQSIEIVKV
jgi:hypothetical protein